MTDDEVKAVAEAIYNARDVISIPREGINTAPFELVWSIPSARAELTRQVQAAISKLDEMRGVPGVYGDVTITPRRCYECESQLRGPYCPKCKSPEQSQ